jgi:hypothetical protein
MARTQAKYLTPEQKRRFFINLFTQHGATLAVTGSLYRSMIEVSRDYWADLIEKMEKTMRESPAAKKSFHPATLPRSQLSRSPGIGVQSTLGCSRNSPRAMTNTVDRFLQHFADFPGALQRSVWKYWHLEHGKIRINLQVDIQSARLHPSR